MVSILQNIHFFDIHQFHDTTYTLNKVWKYRVNRLQDLNMLVSSYGEGGRGSEKKCEMSVVPFKDIDMFCE